jgi:Flp pilus assembly protein TadD
MFALAIRKLNEAIALNTPSSAAYNARGYAYLRSHAYSSALSDFSRAVELRPTYANAYWNRAVVRRLQGDVQGATEDAQKALHLGWVAANSGELKTKASR